LISARGTIIFKEKKPIEGGPLLRHEVGTGEDEWFVAAKKTIGKRGENQVVIWRDCLRERRPEAFAQSGGAVTHQSNGHILKAEKLLEWASGPVQGPKRRHTHKTNGSGSFLSSTVVLHDYEQE